MSQLHSYPPETYKAYPKEQLHPDLRLQGDLPLAKLGCATQGVAQEKVAPFTGAWIETVRLMLPNIEDCCHSRCRHRRHSEVYDQGMRITIPRVSTTVQLYLSVKLELF